MQIAHDTVVSIDYTLRSEDGEVLDASEVGQPLAYLHGHGNIIPGLEKALEGRQAGDQVSTVVPPEEGYGEYSDQLVQSVPRDAFQGVSELEPGMRFQASSDQGPMVVTVKEVGDEEVVVDGNHALAGQKLDFAVTVAEVREASPTELEHGHVHDDGAEH